MSADLLATGEAAAEGFASTPFAALPRGKSKGGRLMNKPMSHPVTDRWAVALHTLYHGHLSGTTCEMCRNVAIYLIGVQAHVIGLVDIDDEVADLYAKAKAQIEEETDSEKPPSTIN